MLDFGEMLCVQMEDSQSLNEESIERVFKGSQDSCVSKSTIFCLEKSHS